MDRFAGGETVSYEKDGLEDVSIVSGNLLGTDARKSVFPNLETNEPANKVLTQSAKFKQKQPKERQA